MAPKRKRVALEAFDPNKSDSDDANFDPKEDQPKKYKKRPKSSRSRSAKGGTQRRDRYGGSDIDDEDDVSGRGDVDSFAESDEDMVDESDDEQGHVTSLGRRVRKAAVKPKNYRESSEEGTDDDGDDDEGDGDEGDGDEGNVDSDNPIAKTRSKPNVTPSPKHPSKIVTIKFTPGAIAPSLTGPTRRSTRARTLDAEDLVELSASGHHAQLAKLARSKSPETLVRGRSSRAAKGLKKVAEPIAESTQESTIINTPLPEADHDDELAHGPASAHASPVRAVATDADKIVEDSDEDAVAADVTASGDLDNDGGIATNGDNMHSDDQDEEDDDVGPVARRARGGRSAGRIDEDHDDQYESAASIGAPSTRRRLTRRSTTKKFSQEQSSDFEPADSNEEGGSGSDSDKNKDDHDSTPPRRSRRMKSMSKGLRGHDSADEAELDQDELAFEAQELRKDSHSQSRRRRRRRSTPIKYQDPKPMERRSRKPVNYAIAPLPGITIEDEEPDDPMPNMGPARRRGGAGIAWDRCLNTTYGPFGGGGTSVLGGPWGPGAAAGADSDSSDDEMMHRSSVGGAGGGGAINIGMTPTTATHPAILPGINQTINVDGLGGLGAAPNVGKIKNQKALADADPIGVDLNTDFSKVGGLQQHIDQLKEMVQLPLLYPELFLRFHVTPPRGVLFHGPPGTGKTLLARALANSASVNGRKITFYMRKGADALSKWVGEAEKQLRLLFEEARRTQPSIIFFDEIDGLAPVRSSKQEQIHASIVSTLLALMDGMDGRGQVIVIGATNRPDNIDPALRRPGRFDREFYFPLPDVEGRRSIIDIHTTDWSLTDKFKDMLAQRTKGCGGADLRALCTEATLNSIQRTYPQIYASNEKLVVDPANVKVHATDFLLALKKLVPSSERSTSSGAVPLPTTIEPLLRDQLNRITRELGLALPLKKKTTALEEAMFEPYNDEDDGFARETLTQEFERSRIFRPRLLIHGIHGMGQNYLASAILHYLEGVHVQNFDLPNLLSDGRPMEQVIVGQFNEIKRHKPSVLFVPNIDSWYEVMRDTLGLRTFQSLLRGVLSTDRVLLLATADLQWEQLPTELRSSFFGYSNKNRIEINRPSSHHRQEFFAPILQHVQKNPGDFPNPENRKKRVLEVLPVAPPPAPKPPSREEIKALEKRDRQLLNILKVQLQPIMDQINRKYKKFRQPVLSVSQIQYLLAESDPHYVRPDVNAAMPRPFEVARDKHGNESLRETATGKIFYNLDTTTIEERLSNGFYTRPRDFLFDIQTLAKDSRNIGDKERTLKANELVSNVEVDAAVVESNTSNVNWEELYQRQLQRARQREEKEGKRRAAQAQAHAQAQAQAQADGQSEGTQPTQANERIQSDVTGGNDSDSQGPVTLGEAIPGSRSITMARFQLKSPLPNGSHSSGHDADRSGVSQDISGTSGSHNDDDIEMGGTFAETQEPSQMRPPSIITKPAVKPNGQLSQRSAVTSLPPGVSPSQLVNDASTTKTSDLSLSRSSGNWTPVTNGYHGDQSSLIAEDMPDTQRAGHASQISVRSSGQSVSIISTVSRSSSSPSSGQRAHASAHSRPSISNILNSSPSSPSLQTSGSSLAPRHAVPVDETSASALLDSITSKTSGLTIEQLEQVYRELMSEIWATRGEWNRNRVLDRLKHVFNLAIRDIEDNQPVLQSSQ